jgi:hypothetical protein
MAMLALLVDTSLNDAPQNDSRPMFLQQPRKTDTVPHFSRGRKDFILLLTFCLPPTKDMSRDHFDNEKVQNKSGVPLPSAARPQSRCSSDVSSGSSSDESEGSTTEGSCADAATVLAEKSEEIISIPGCFDVLLGRGKYHYCHEGNVRMLRIVESFKPQYKRARKPEKTEITRCVLALIIENDDQEEGHGLPVRFLERTRLGWYEVDRRVAHKKVAHCLREKKSSVSTGGSILSGKMSKNSKTSPPTSNELPNLLQDEPEIQFEPLCPHSMEAELSTEEAKYLQATLFDEDSDDETAVVA